MGGTTSEPAWRAGPASSVARRWPAALAVGVAALMWGAEPEPVGRLLMVLPLIYLTLAVLGRRSWSWPVLAASVGLFLALEAQSTVDPPAALWTVAGAVALTGFHPRVGRRPAVAVQALAFVGFAAVATVALSVAPDVGRVLAAAGWLAHGLWDLAHRRRNQVVSRSYAEWCGVLDLLIAAQLLLLM